jgi:PHD/YefM family antitoxin component YafN of YafNO toxin-antitoxin module
MTLLTSEEKELLSKAANLMEELLETIEVAQDKKLVRHLKAALREVEEGKTVSLGELVRDLGLEAEVRS